LKINVFWECVAKVVFRKVGVPMSRVENFKILVVMAILTCGAISFIGSTIVIFLAEMGVVKELPHVEEVLCVGAIASILFLDYLLPDKE
jgi:hypothetical protein